MLLCIHDPSSKEVYQDHCANFDFDKIWIFIGFYGVNESEVTCGTAFLCPKCRCQNANNIYIMPTCCC